MNPVLITGAKGFIGQHLSRFISELGVPVAGLGHGAMAPTIMERLGITDWVNGDVNHANLQQLRHRLGPISCIFHLAGGSHVGRSFRNPAEDFHRTVNAASCLFEWTRLIAPETSIVVVSSAAVYGAGHRGPIPEDAPFDPFSPYGAHKAILESLARSYCSNFGLRIAICRLFSVYGEGLEKQLIFDLCRKCADATDHITLGGTGSELRDWIHVSDVARLLWLIRDHCGPECLVLNGGTGIGTSVAEVARLVVAAWSEPLEPVFDGRIRSGDPDALVADISKASSLGFRPEVSIEDGFQKVTDWYRSTMRQRSSRD